jgi:Rrf2 family protein
MNVPAKVDYAMRAILEIAARDHPASGDSLAEAQSISSKFLSAILNDLRRAGLVISGRGADAGYRLSRTPDQITVADVIRAIDGPIGVVRNIGPEATQYSGAATHLTDVWVAARAGLRQVFEEIALTDILDGRFGDGVSRLLGDPNAWEPEYSSIRVRPESEAGVGSVPLRATPTPGVTRQLH